MNMVDKKILSSLKRLREDAQKQYTIEKKKYPKPYDPIVMKIKGYVEGLDAAIDMTEFIMKLAGKKID